MKTVITALFIAIVGIISCDTPEPTTGSQGDTTTINSNRPDTTSTSTDTTARRDSIPHP